MVQKNSLNEKAQFYMHTFKYPKQNTQNCQTAFLIVLVFEFLK